MFRRTIYTRAPARGRAGGCAGGRRTAGLLSVRQLDADPCQRRRLRNRRPRARTNSFVHLGAAGVQIGVIGGAFPNNTTIVGNVFRDTGGSGLQVGGVNNVGNADNDDIPRNTTITNNWFSDVGAEHAGAVALFQGYTRNSIIQHNQVNGVPYSGISSGWGWGYQSSVTSGNMILANLVFDHMLHLIDGGGIYLVGDQGSGPERANHPERRRRSPGRWRHHLNFIHGRYGTQ